MFHVPILCALLAMLGAAVQCSADNWQQVGTENLRNGVGAVSPRSAGPAIYNGRYIFVWGGADTNTYFGNGGVYDLVNDTWIYLPNLTTAIGAPSGRCCCVGVWTPFGFFVWGGANTVIPNPRDGGMYDMATDNWLPLQDLELGTGLPGGSVNGFGCWTGDSVLVYGGYQSYLGPSSFRVDESVHWGALYDPALDSWGLPPVLGTPTSTAPWFNGGFAWTGSQLLARAGQVIHSNFTGLATNGGVYDLKSDSWLHKPVLNGFAGVPNGMFYSTWTGTGYIEWGGISPIVSQPPFIAEEFYSRGLAYAPSFDMFPSLPNLEAPAPIERRVGAAVMWTGAQVLVYGGQGQPRDGVLNPVIPVGHALYSPDHDSWSLAPGLNHTTTTSVGAVADSRVWTGDRFVTLFGHYRNGSNTVLLNTGGVYHPPRVAPTVRNLSAGDAGASASNPLVVTVGEKFRHRIVCYGCPEAALMPTTQLPAWLNIGWGGPTQLVAHGTGAQAPGGIGQPFSPWFSAEGLTCDGQWLQGTPTAADIGLQSFTFYAHNGVAPDTQTYTVWLEVIGSPVFTSFPPPTTATAGESYSHSVTAVGNPTPVVTLSGLPTWLSYSNGMLAGTPPISAGGTIQGPFTLSASNGQPPAATQLFSVQVAHAYTDTNRDRAVNVTDVQLTVNIILGLAQKQWPEQGDADRNSVVNVVDVQRVVNKILNP